MAKKIRDLIRDLKKVGFVDRGGKGSHRNFVHPKITKPITISGNENEDANPDFSQGFVAKPRRCSWIQGARRTGDAGILVNMLRRLFKCNNGDMKICEVVAESL